LITQIETRPRLATARDPVTAIMLESGFGTKSNFNRELLRVTGITPSSYRRAGPEAPAASDGRAEASSSHIHSTRSTSQKKRPESRSRTSEIAFEGAPQSISSKL
jgi:AraC-like DNA-binding protein